MYVDVRRKVVKLISEKLNGNARVFLLQWAGEEVIFGHGGEMTDLADVPLTVERYLCVGGNERRRFTSTCCAMVVCSATGG